MRRPTPTRTARDPRRTAVTSLGLVGLLLAGATASTAAPGTGQPAGGTGTAQSPPVTTARLPAPAAEDTGLQPDVLVRASTALTPAALARLERLAPGSLAVRSGSLTLAAVPLAATGPAVAPEPATPKPAGAPKPAAAAKPATTPKPAAAAKPAAASVVGVGPTFRTWTAPGTAEADGVWQAVQRGEAVVSHAVAQRLRLPLGGQVTLTGAGGARLQLRLGAFATTGLPASEVVVADSVAARLRLPARSAVLLKTDGDPVALARSARAAAGTGASIDLLTQSPSPVAALKGTSGADAFGTFSYRYSADGTITPDPAWVRDNIRTETVPIFGRVTCHRLMLPQLRGALTEIAAAGLATTLTTYDGCYVPRFIERNPARPISLHTWGIAIDLDAATNYRGIRGTMHPQVVAIFKRWGFRWGGDWRYTDPMHFELGTVLTR